MEAYHWSSGRDPSFARFTDIFSNRFLQLFFRAWADARPIAQHDRPDDDRFIRYVGSFAGIGVDSLNGARQPRGHRQAAVCRAGRARASRARRGCRQLVRGHLQRRRRHRGARRLAGWSSSRPTGCCSAPTASTLGVDTYLGGRVYSINEKICICIKARDLDAVPAVPAARRHCSTSSPTWSSFTSAIASNSTCELSLPARYAPPARLGVSGELGWTAWIAPDNDAGRGRLFRRRAFQRAANGAAAEASRPGDARSCIVAMRRKIAMSDISLETVTGKLNRLGYDAFMRALRHAKKRGQPQCRAGALDAAHPHQRPLRHRADARPLQARPRASC